MKLGRVTPFVMSLLLLGACATATPYQPAEQGQRGFADQQIENNRWQISFSGNSLTDRRTVETYLLYRAAELTEQSGFNHFRVVNRDTDETSTFVPTSISRTPYYSGFYCDYAFYSPYGRFRNPGFSRSAFSRAGYGRSSFYDPFGYGFGAADYREIVRYEARAEIIMGAGEKPADDPAYFAASEVLTNLSPSIVRPET
ncbi:MAG: hypothetical protein AAF253_14310 [Pseudomonadota bacterium]